MPGALRIAGSLTVSLLLSVALVFAVEIVSRGSFESTLAFFARPSVPAGRRSCLFALADWPSTRCSAAPMAGLLIIAPLVLIPAWISSAEGHYLGDPFYPTDFLYARQIVELLPLLVQRAPADGDCHRRRDRRRPALLVATGSFALAQGARAELTRKGRLARLALALPVLAIFVSIMDYASFSWARDRLQIIPMMWDQKENYAFNGFTLAFALNLPMANVPAPAGYSADAVGAIPGFPAASVPAEKPDIIMVMSESFWDPTQAARRQDHARPDPDRARAALRLDVLAGVRRHDRQCRVRGADRLLQRLPALWQHPLPAIYPHARSPRSPPSCTARAMRRGRCIRSANGSGTAAPSTRLSASRASCRRSELPPMAKRGPLASDAAFTEEIIRQADG